MTMLSKAAVLFLTGLMAWTLGCGAAARVVDPGRGPSIATVRAESAHSAKLRLAVMDFDNKTRYAVGRGMQAMLASALFECGRFIVLERAELSDVLMEQKLGAAGVISRDTAAPIGEVEGAQVLVFGTVSEFEPAQRGLTTMLGGAQQSHVAIDLRLVDARTARILSTTTVEGKATDVQLTSKMLRYVGMSPMYSLEVWNHTPTGSAIRLCIDEAVASIVERLEDRHD